MTWQSFKPYPNQKTIPQPWATEHRLTLLRKTRAKLLAEQNRLTVRIARAERQLRRLERTISSLGYE